MTRLKIIFINIIIFINSLSGAMTMSYFCIVKGDRTSGCRGRLTSLQLAGLRSEEEQELILKG